MANRIGDDEVMEDHGVEFIIRFPNPHPSAFDSIESLPNWNLTATIGEFRIYRRVPPKRRFPSTISGWGFATIAAERSERVVHRPLIVNF
jgi:pterin-4a-carbinolamine dehydratase